MKEQLKTILLFLSLIIIVIRCDQKKKNNEIADATTHDSSYAVIPHDTSSKYKRDIFDEDLETTSLTHEDFVAIDSLFNACIINHNDSQNDNRYRIDLSKKYKKQLIAVLNNKGEKEVWVNCFCDEDPKWKTQIVMVFDGGNCYFNFKVNLSTKNYYDLRVNGSIDEK